MKIPKLKFDPEFEERSDKDKIAYLKELASSMNHAADIMQKERNQLAIDLKKQLSLVENAEKALAIQKTITQNQLISGNQQIQELSNQIQQLQARTKAQDSVIETLNKEIKELKSK